MLVSCKISLYIALYCRILIFSWTVPARVLTRCIDLSLLLHSLLSLSPSPFSITLSFLYHPLLSLSLSPFSITLSLLFTLSFLYHTLLSLSLTLFLSPIHMILWIACLARIKKSFLACSSLNPNPQPSNQGGHTKCSLLLL